MPIEGKMCIIAPVKWMGFTLLNFLEKGIASPWEVDVYIDSLYTADVIKIKKIAGINRVLRIIMCLIIKISAIHLKNGGAPILKITPRNHSILIIGINLSIPLVKSRLRELEFSYEK